MLFDRRDVFELELGRARPAAAAAETLPGPDLKDVGAETRDLLLHRGGGRVAQRHHRDDRADPDDDAEDGQERAQQMAPDRSQREDEGGAQPQCALTRRSEERRVGKEWLRTGRYRWMP